MAFAAWMAAMWYLPRLFIYHRESPIGGEASATFMVMERRLLKAIGTPAMVVTIVLGLVLASLQGQWSQGWLHAKLVLVFGIAACHGMMARDVRLFGADERPHSTGWYRVFNEVPTLLFVGIVLLAVFKPF
jgi:protoporphyrinogen IX oxidase